MFRSREPALLPRRTRTPLSPPDAPGAAPQHSFLALVRRALTAYVLDAPLYIAMAAIGFGLQYLVMFVLPAANPIARDSKLILINLVVDAAINAVVYVGVAARDAGEKQSWATTLDKAFFRRLGARHHRLPHRGHPSHDERPRFGTPEQTVYGLLGVPIVLLWTALTFPKPRRRSMPTPPAAGSSTLSVAVSARRFAWSTSAASSS